ncbi:Holliday junction branch migration protein RuvA [Ligilactobacillus salivarius]|mgnify:FL=1|uniref:Holliday junction branch migration complex subunit RuvA n=2 Tax=Ligilactobacillus salivarius TaxID=1624 RepID=A0A1V9S9C5_9LACO|nr:Holliday junction branch migration protein RuvA [Ligilactobacillus salivarius]HBU67507.1 Holliday junction branch migration protein RuvA [Lactobacillus sp.]ADJ79203.1 Holliday junction ATP-dependent DNA helicase ruvA [Ligilactobacillus salivarius CECT 5713]ATP35932.1 Holliday junction branch migration protein RuvA [Ligilactobacillus salivarius]EFK78760.1 Holliday junction DNA helicase RuvA [Ligilactobacillus salivarius ACS-116-V-Col5a]EGM52441.1 Holliday junction DNA helicase RuvA [Ligilact
MYEYLRGVITEVTPYYIVVDVNGVGYQVYVANPFKYEEDEHVEQKVFVYQAVRDNDISLYGFKNSSEKQLFLKLLDVSGIGPKSALAILANDDNRGLINAINSDDDGYLTKFPGIGKKTAKQIILDLKGKLSDVDSDMLTGQDNLDLDLNASSPYLKESLEALRALGYTKTEVKRISKKLEKYDGKSTDDYLRQGLRLLMS